MADDPANKAPTVHHGGRWKPGQSGNPKGRPKSKPYKDALDRALRKLSDSDNAEDMLDRIAAAHITRCMEGDMAAIKELADRHDGKVPQGIGQAEELGALQISWKPTTSLSTTPQDDNSFLSIIEQSASLASSPTDEPEKP